MNVEKGSDIQMLRLYLSRQRVATSAV